MNSPVTVLFLYNQVPGYLHACLRAYARPGIHEAVVVHRQSTPESPFQLREIPGVRFIRAEGHSADSLHALATQVHAAAVFVSGWSNRVYRAAALRLRRDSGRRVVCCFDNTWSGTARQRLLRYFGRRYLQQRYSDMWVAGEPQRDYASRLGFSNERIASGFYAADTELFGSCAPFQKADGFRELFFVGRFSPEKGLQDLLAAFAVASAGRQQEWRLRLIGEGALRQHIPAHPNIAVSPYLQPPDLVRAAATASAFVLPSRFEPWGVVLHEFAAVGVPLVASDAVGSASEFLEPERNGYVFCAGSVEQLAAALDRVFAASDERRAEMGARSRELAAQNTPAKWAATLTSFLAC